MRANKLTFLKHYAYLFFKKTQTRGYETTSLLGHSIYFPPKHAENRSAARHKGETHQVCPNVMLLHLCVRTRLFYASTLRQMGVICHSGWVSVWWSDCISRVNADGEPGPPPLHKYVQRGNGRRERINWWNDGKGARGEPSIMSIHYWVGALGGMGGIRTG